MTIGLLTVLFLALMTWAGCSDDPSFVEPQETEEATLADLDPKIRQAIKIQDRHTPELMARPGVVGTATRVSEDGTPQIVVFVESQEASKQQPAPAELEGVSVVVEVSGMFLAHDPNTPTTKERPAPNGFSVGHPDITAGTIGAAVTDGSNTYILSNNHVLANSNNATIGDPILQPGPFDGGTSADQIGTLHAFEPISFSSNNTMDAAIAIVNPADLTYATPTAAYGAPGTSVRSTGLLGLNVQKFGRTTGHTHGEITSINATISVCYKTRGPFSCAQAATFVNQIIIEPGAFSAGGDSGSLIVTDDSNKNPVALLFAGSTSHTIASPIGPVLNRFGVSIATGSGGTTNDPPTASFTYSCTDLSCSFDGAGSTDGDGSISSYSWNFGDGSSASGTPASHTYQSGGSYTVTLTVTDDDNATDSETKTVSVSSASGGITLSATGYKVQGRQRADLTWNGATSTNVDVYRSGIKVTTTANDGAHTDNINQRGGGSYTYQVCEAGTSTCSNTVTVTF